MGTCLEHCPEMMPPEAGAKATRTKEYVGMRPVVGLAIYHLHMHGIGERDCLMICRL